MLFWTNNCRWLKWCIIIKALVEPSCYDTAPSTVAARKPSLEGEPAEKEYRCRASTIFGELHKEWEKRKMSFTESHKEDSEATRNVVVQSVLFVDLNFWRTLDLLMKRFVKIPFFAAYSPLDISSVLCVMMWWLPNCWHCLSWSYFAK